MMWTLNFCPRLEEGDATIEATGASSAVKVALGFSRRVESLKRSGVESSRVVERRFIAPEVMPKCCVVLKENQINI
jgi:hypothetical protein